MRTMLFLASGLLLRALAVSLALWLAITGANMWIGVSKAGYSVAEELPILVLLFAVPAAAAVLVRWRFF